MAASLGCDATHSLLTQEKPSWQRRLRSSNPRGETVLAEAAKVVKPEVSTFIRRIAAKGGIGFRASCQQRSDEEHPRYGDEPWSALASLI
jgi:hypothetical protein